MDIDSIKLYGRPDASNIIIQPADDHDLGGMDNEVSETARLTGGDDFCIAALFVDKWFIDLSPWEAPPVFRKDSFGSGAPDTLKFITDVMIPYLETEHPYAGSRRFYIGGYSLSALFSLWAVYQTDIFSGAAVASPSAWFPGWIEYSEQHEIKTPAVYLSLGDREERTRNQVMATVGTCIKKQEKILKDAGIDTVLVWNKGNHFKNSDLRTAAGFAWLLNRGRESETRK
jgi:predicted alpha/beta superfamily hydrolase